MVFQYRLLYSETSHRQIRKLHPALKTIVKSFIERIRENPYIGKRLEKELSGYFSFRTKRYRIIYKIDEDESSIQIHYVGHRRDIYELFGEIIKKTEKRQ